MLCSVPPANKSGSNWLDRLRSNKGFPTGDNLDLDHFLTRNPNSSSEIPNANALASTESTRLDSGRVANGSQTSYPNRDSQGEAAFVGLMDNVLSELFFMGGADESSKLSGKKIPRKQTNPRVCVASSATNSNSNGDATANVTEEKSSDCGLNDENALHKAASLSSDNRSLVEEKKKKKKRRELRNVECEEEEVEEEEEEEEEKGEMKGYSRSEVTVIDTSCGVWKTEKLVFRKKNVWKVREKKVKVRSFGRHNKRKVVDEEEEVVGVDKKKAKVSGLEEADGDECIALKSIQNSQNELRKSICKEKPANLNESEEEFRKDIPFNTKAIKNRFPLNRPPRKMKKGDSSVILIKGLPTDNKNGGNLPRKRLKDSRKQYKA